MATKHPILKTVLKAITVYVPNDQHVALSKLAHSEGHKNVHRWAGSKLQPYLMEGVKKGSKL